MNFTGLSATAIWASPVRNLTSLGLNTVIIPSTTQQTLAAASSVDARPASATVIGESTIAVVTGAAATGTMQIGLFDGVNTMVLAASAAAANAPAAFTLVQTSVVGGRITNNDGAVAGKYMSCGWRLQQ